MGGSRTDLRPTKPALRRTLGLQRQSREPADRHHLGELLAQVALEFPPLRAASCVALYVSLPEEPATGPLRRRLRERGCRVLLPVLTSANGDEAPMTWAVDDDDLIAGPVRGIPQPSGPRLGPAGLQQAQAVLVPALAVDTRGHRLGRGGGHYDRALPQADPRSLVLALLHDEELLDARSCPVPREEHDVPVHGVLTARRWMLFGEAALTAQRQG